MGRRKEEDDSDLTLTCLLGEDEDTYKQNVSTRIGAVKKQNPAISMITRLYNS